MSGLQVFGSMLMILGAFMTFFVRRFIEDSDEKLRLDEDGDYGEVMSKTAMIIKIIGFVIVAAGAVVFFISA